jgi:N-acyl-D-amino-acid deacylase
VSDFVRLVAGRLAQNVAVLASQGTIRHNVAGATDRPLDTAEIAAARAEVEQSLVDGAVGLSSGFDYIPSRFGSPAELAALCAPLSQPARPYVSHLRAYGPDVRAGLGELALVGRRAGVPVHASHLYGTAADIEAALAAAADAGIEMTFDMYPYLRSSTILAMLVLPAQVQIGGTAATLRRLADPDIRRALLNTEQLSPGFLDRLTLGAVPVDQAHHAGETITRAATESGTPPGTWTLDLLLTSELQIGAHYDRPEFSDTDLHWIVTHPRHAAGSDGIYQGQHPHPRANGAFARLTQHYRDPTGQPDYQRLVRHLSTRAADAYRLTSRGRLAPGKTADICVLTPGGLVDTATYQDPTSLATGVSLVLVNGTPVWRDGGLIHDTHPGIIASG